VTAYVPLRSATERERAAFLIPCQGLRDYFTSFQVTLTQFAGIARLCYIKFILEK